MKEHCPNCNDSGEQGRSWFNLVPILREQVRMGINHWLCLNCYHTWYDEQGPFGEVLNKETEKELDELQVQFVEKVTLAINRFVVPNKGRTR